MSVTSPRGTIVRDADGVRLEFVRAYDAPVEDVWAALTEPERVARWFGRWSGDPATGQVEVVMTAEEGGTPSVVTIVECVPPTRLVVDAPGGAGDPWRLELTVEARDAGTELRFLQRLRKDEDASSIGPGWHFYLDRLGAVVTATPVPDVWDDYYPALREAYEAPS